VTGGSLIDNFDPFAVHVYQITLTGDVRPGGVFLGTHRYREQKYERCDRVGERAASLQHGWQPSRNASVRRAYWNGDPGGFGDGSDPTRQ